MTHPDCISPQMSEWLAEAWAQEAEIRAVAVDGAQVRYRAWNLGDTSKPGLLFVHGFLGHARWWDHIAPHFCARYRVIAADYTGMGDSDWRAAYTREQYSHELLAVAQDAGFDRLTIISHSFGSVSALWAAHLARELVERTIVVDAKVFDLSTQLPLNPSAGKRYPDFETALARYKLLPPGRWPVAEILNYVGRHSLKQTEQGEWTWKFDPILLDTVTRDTSLSTRLRGLELPVDFIYGEHSEVATENIRSTFVAQMPQCGKLVTVPLSHHHVMIEQPVGLVAALNGLLARGHAASRLR